jgi:gas vesicle protein
MKERKTNKQSHKQTRNIVNPFLDDKLRQRLSKAVAKAGKLIKPMDEESNKRDKDELSDELTKQIKEISSVIKEITERREAAEAIRDEIKDDLDKDFLIGMCGIDFCDDEDDNDDEDETKFYGDTKYIKLTPKEFKQILEYFGNTVRSSSAASWMYLLKTRLDKLQEWGEPFAQKAHDFEKTDLYKAHEGLLDSLVKKVIREEF